MCGISGYYSFGGSIIPLNELKEMNMALHHRGPDSHGIFSDERVTLMHNRLSILDISSSGDQPFNSKSERYVISYNGEIFNYKALRKEFNINVHTGTDTEIVIELFGLLGHKSLNKLNGMFAFAIYDKLEKKLFLVRDRMGIKPIYYYQNKDVFVFASEMKALLQVSSIKNSLTINQNAVFSFLHLGYIPDPDSIYNEIRKIQPGNMIEVNSKGTTSHEFWKLDKIVNEKTETTTYKAAKAKFENLMQSSVGQRMVSDVPLGIFLSGGVDSSLIAAIAKQNHTGPLKTFTVGYKDDKYNELPHAKKIADYLGTDHHELLLEEKEAMGMLDDLLDHFDEPYADSSLFPTYFISRYASNTVKTVLAGEGSDELFMGYGVYNWPARLITAGSARKMIGDALKYTPDNRFKKSALMFSHYSSKNPFSHIYSQEQGFFTEKELSELLLNKSGKNLTDHFKIDLKHLKRELGPEEIQSFFDLKYSLTGDLLTKVDRASMYCSLEVREPYLDYRLIEFAVNLPIALKVKGNITKRLVKDALYNYIPENYFNRPKRGFSIPLEKWLKGELRYLIDEVLSKEAIETTGLFDYEKIKDLKIRFTQGESYLYNRLWAMIVLQKWMIKNRSV
jgi:asparagine synthase (glutamine-hydrolysing)